MLAIGSETTSPLQRRKHFYEVINIFFMKLENCFHEHHVYHLNKKKKKKWGGGGHGNMTFGTNKHELSSYCLNKSHITEDSNTLYLMQTNVQQQK